MPSLSILRLAKASAPLVLIVGLAASACKDRAAQARAPESEAAQSSSPTLADQRRSAARRLALADPGDHERVDHEVRSRQRRAEQLGDASEGWILLGHAWVKKARATRNSTGYANARAAAEVVLEREPQNPLALNIVAQALLERHEFAEALDIVRGILHYHPEDLQALGSLADATLELGRYPEALSAVDKLNDLKPGLPGYARAAHLQWLRGDRSAALETYRLAIESARDPSDPEPRCWVMVQAAYVFWHQADYDGADAGFQRALESCTDYAPALIGRGRVALALGHVARAVELLTKAWKKSPDTETAWRLGDALTAAGDLPGAERHYARVVSEGARHDPRTTALFLATKQRDTALAVRLAEEEMRRRPNVYTADALAWALHRAGRAGEAKSAAERALSLGTKDAALLYHSGAIRMASGDARGGSALVREALELNPNFDPTGAPEARKLLLSQDRGR
jgi:tetratricopeptide (TPR) repeat protein